MSIFKDTFRDYVRNQLELREELIGVGNPDKFNEHEGNTNRKNSAHTFTGRNGKVNIQAGAHHAYALNKQCVIRATSLVDYVSDVGLDIGGLGEQSYNRLRGASLSQNFILQGGILSDFARSGESNRKVRKLDQVRQSFPRPGVKTNLGYGDFAIGADASEDGYGIVPMPGIIDATIRTKSAYGSLREGKINFEVHNKRQLEIMEMLYMRPGYMVLLEWGWCPYIASSGGIEERGKIVNELRLVENASNGDIYTNKITQNACFNYINALKQSQDGNYDGMLGFVKNFGFKAREDGGYSCFTELTSIGEVIESLKVPPVSIVNTSTDRREINSGDGDIIVSNGEASEAPPITSLTVADKQEYLAKIQSQKDLQKGLNQAELALLLNPFTANLVMTDNLLQKMGITDESIMGQLRATTTNTANRASGLSNVTRETYDKAIATNVFPSFNGLLGLMNVINNYTVFGFGETNSDAAVDQLSNVFTVLQDEKKLEGLEEDTTEYKKLQSQISKQGRKITNVSGTLGGASRTNFLKNLITFQSADFEAVLLKKLNIKSKNNLLNYIIPTTSRGNAPDIFIL